MDGYVQLHCVVHNNQLIPLTECTISKDGYYQYDNRQFDRYCVSTYSVLLKEGKIQQPKVVYSTRQPKLKVGDFVLEMGNDGHVYQVKEVKVVEPKTPWLTHYKWTNEPQTFEIRPDEYVMFYKRDIHVTLSDDHVTDEKFLTKVNIHFNSDNDEKSNNSN